MKYQVAANWIRTEFRGLIAAQLFLAIALCALILSCAAAENQNSTRLNWDGHLCAQMIDDHERAIEHCNLAIESRELSASGLASTYNNRGWHFSELGRVEEALADYSRAIEMGQRSTAYFNRGSIYEAQGDRIRARADFKRAYELAPELKSHQDKAKEYSLIK